MTWRNWTGDQECHPAETIVPSDRDELAAAVVRVGERGLTVRVAGAGHSFTPAVLTDGLLVSLVRMNRVLHVDESSGSVRVEAGITLHDLNERLDQHGRALENLGDIDVQSVAGATATGTHGTGARLRNLSAAIHSLELMLGDGSIVELDEAGDPDGWRAARVGIGALGIVTSVTLRTVPAFTLEARDEPKPLAEVLDSLDSYADSNDHFEFYSFPHSTLANVRVNNRVDGPPRPRSKMKAWVAEELLVNGLYGWTRRIGRRFPATIPTLNRIAARAWGSSHRVDRSYSVFASPRKVRFTEMEYAIPRRHAVPAIKAVRSVADRRDLNVSFPIEVRFVAPDDAFLSPAGGRDTCYIAVHVYEGMGWRRYFEEVEAIMDGFEGRPHWGKRHFQTADTLRPRYPGWDRFATVRDRLDPNRRFTNDYIKQVLGP
ncbi:MAG: D-arabinono-1,4-lactone oxidase [Actinomycetota bacterium]